MRKQYDINIKVQPSRDVSRLDYTKCNKALMIAACSTRNIWEIVKTLMLLHDLRQVACH